MESKGLLLFNYLYFGHDSTHKPPCSDKSCTELVVNLRIKDYIDTRSAVNGMEVKFYIFYKRPQHSSAMVKPSEKYLLSNQVWAKKYDPWFTFKPALKLDFNVLLVKREITFLIMSQNIWPTLIRCSLFL